MPVFRTPQNCKIISASVKRTVQKIQVPETEPDILCVVVVIVDIPYLCVKRVIPDDNVIGTAVVKVIVRRFQNCTPSPESTIIERIDPLVTSLEIFDR